MAGKSVRMRFTVFDISQITVEPSEIKLGKKLHEILDGTSSLQERRMVLNEDDPGGDSDFITNFKYVANILFGSFVRLKAGESSVFLTRFLDQKLVDINDIVAESGTGTAGTITGTVFFCISDNLLVMSEAHHNRKHLQNYFNWILLERASVENPFVLTPKKNSAVGIPIKEVQSIKLGEVFLSQPSMQDSLKKIRISSLAKLFSDMPTPQDFKQEDIISATLTLRIRKREMDKSRSLDAVLRIVDEEDVIITDRNGKTIRGTEYVVKADKMIEQNETGYYNESLIESEMIEIIRKVKNNEVVN